MEVGAMLTLMWLMGLLGSLIYVAVEYRRHGSEVLKGRLLCAAPTGIVPVWAAAWLLLKASGLRGWPLGIIALAVAVAVAGALNDVFSAQDTPAGRNKRSAAGHRLILTGALFVLTLAGGSNLLASIGQKKAAIAGRLATDAGPLTFDQATHVTGLVRDVDYVRLHGLNNSMASLTGSWDTRATAEGGLESVKRMAAGYTIVLAQTPPTDPAGSWLELNKLSPEARAYLKALWERQQIADSPKWPGHWVDPASGEPLPFRFYRVKGEGDKPDRYIRVAGADVRVGPKGEAVYDLSLYWDEVKTFPDGTTALAREVLMKGAVNLGTPYTGGKAPSPGLKGLIWN